MGKTEEYGAEGEVLERKRRLLVRKEVISKDLTWRKRRTRCGK